MHWTIDRISALIAFLRHIFEVPLANMDDGQRGNPPPVSGENAALAHLPI